VYSAEQPFAKSQCQGASPMPRCLLWLTCGFDVTDQVNSHRNAARKTSFPLFCVGSA
jgi:hypothetical protein